MVLLGIMFGLAAAFAQSLSYIFTRVFVIKHHKGVLRLFALGHVVMGVVSLAALPILWRGDIPDLSAFIWPLIGLAGFYMTGQASLFILLRRIDASRIAPLLALKIVVLALISILFLGNDVSLLQWAGVILCVASAFVLNRTGDNLSWRILAGIAVACPAYALADLHIQWLVGSLDGLGRLHAVMLGVCMCYIICGGVGTVMLWWIRPVSLAEFRYALPFAVSWLVAMGFLFACFGTIGAVFGNIPQSTRGLFSIMMGAVLARWGMVHLERKHPRHVVLRQLVAGAMMCLAIALYSMGTERNDDVASAPAVQTGDVR